MSLPSQTGQKRKGLWNQHIRSNPVRTFTRIPGRNSLLLNSSRVTTSNQSESGSPDASPTSDDEFFQPANDEGGFEGGSSQPRERTTVSQNPVSSESDTPLKTWVAEYRTTSLDEQMRYEGRGTKRNGEWNGSFFAGVTLRDIGLQVQLGENHPPGTPCVFKRDVHKDFIVLHTNGIHLVNVDSCGCSGLNPGEPPISLATQLLCAGWYPATHRDPKTCTMFELMHLFHLLSLQSKVSHYHFYKSLHYKTDNTGIHKIPYRYPAFCLMAQKWCHETMVKRGGRAFVQSNKRIEETAQGELAVLCRACPIPDINLPSDWADGPPKFQFLYILIVCIDACFWFKNRLRSSDEKDPTLGPGWAFMVDHGPYLDHVKKYATEKEISTCASFAAVHLANLKGIKGHRTSGVAGVCCARQDCFRPNGVGDLQVGERHANIDYIFLSAIFGFALMFIIASYDIACQCLKGFWTRLPRLPEHLHPNVRPENLLGKIPKFHYDAHIKKDHAQYSFNFTRGVGRVNGEGIERLWGWIKKGVGQTVEMGPGACRDILDDFFGYSNYRKMTDIGNSLLKGMAAAIPEAITHQRAYEEFDAHLRQEMPEQVQEWDRLYIEWDKKPTDSPCLFDTAERPISLAKVKLQLADAEAAKDGLETTAAHTPSTFILLALEIEDLQRKLLSDIKEHPNPTALQQTAFQERRVIIRKRIVQIWEFQATYMPGLRTVLPDPTVLDDAPSARAETMCLYFPSDLAGRDRDRACIKGLAEVEARIRQALACDNLHDLRQHLLTRTFLSKWRVKNVSGQRTGTCTRSLQHVIDMKVADAKTRYRRSREALLALRGKGSWETHLQELHNDDVRSLNERLMTEHERIQRDPVNHEALDGVPVEDALGDGKRSLSWIWIQFRGADENSPEMVEALRVEWAKCRARSSRWKEELMLLKEEMRCVLKFGEWKECWWTARISMRAEQDEALMEGLRAYALEHADIEYRFRTMLDAKWKSIKERVEVVLADLAKPVYSETPVSTPLVVDVDYDEEPEDDTNGGTSDWPLNREEEEEEIAQLGTRINGQMTGTGTVMFGQDPAVTVTVNRHATAARQSLTATYVVTIGRGSFLKCDVMSKETKDWELGHLGQVRSESQVKESRRGWISSAKSTTINHLRHCRNVTEVTRARANDEHRRNSRSASPARRAPVPTPLDTGMHSEYPHGVITLDSPTTPSYGFGYSTPSVPPSPTTGSFTPPPTSQSHHNLASSFHRPSRPSSSQSFNFLSREASASRSHSRGLSAHSHAEFIQPPWTKERQEGFKTAVAQLTVSAGFPLTWVDNPEWIDFCAEYIPGAKSPSRRSLTSRIIPKAVSSLRTAAEASTRGQLATVEADGFTGLNKHHLLAFMIASNGKRKTADLLLARLEAVIQEVEARFGVRVVAVCTDASGECRKARRELLKKYPYLIINLVVGDYFGQNAVILKITKQANDLITWLRSKTLLLGMIREIRDKLGLSPLSVLWAVITRWTAHYLAFRRLLELEPSLRAVISKDDMQQNPAKKAVVIGDAKPKRRARRMVKIIQNPLFWHGIVWMKRHLEPLAIAANITQASFCRMDQVLLTFGHLVMTYKKLTDTSDFVPCNAIIKSIEKQWEKTD
ncbi:hypothetical protein HWV62_11944 [Athelia sp. TMB]|nr:hypothetical protein HWV62_11944 [Athelia sp. TMB]